MDVRIIGPYKGFFVRVETRYDWIGTAWSFARIFGSRADAESDENCVDETLGPPSLDPDQSRKSSLDAAYLLIGALPSRAA
jgi:hypothetical protein